MPNIYPEDIDLSDVPLSTLFGHTVTVTQFGYNEDRYNFSVSCLTRQQFDELCKVMRSWDNVITHVTLDDDSRTYFTYSSGYYG